MENTEVLDVHEAKCRRCGRCCFNKIFHKGRIFYTPFPCQYLDKKTRLCTIYEQRHRINPDCLPVPEGLKLGVFPKDCPYAQEVPNYKPPVLNTITKELATLIEFGKVKDF
jgi:uncharacterized cysteine cluster protein YcgN (CxxCxxCC family)